MLGDVVGEREVVLEHERVREPATLDVAQDREVRLGRAGQRSGVRVPRARAARGWPADDSIEGRTDPAELSQRLDPAVVAMLEADDVDRLDLPPRRVALDGVVGVVEEELQVAAHRVVDHQRLVGQREVAVQDHELVRGRAAPRIPKIVISA